MYKDRKSKTCPTCGMHLSLHEFHKDKYSPNGHTVQCKKCRLAKKKEWSQRPPVKSKRAKQAREYRKTDKGNAETQPLNKNYFNLKRFNGLREIVLENYGYECSVCGTSKSLCVHHIDGHGRNSTTPNNTLENLTVLCVSCHMRYHQVKRCKNDKI